MSQIRHDNRERVRFFSIKCANAWGTQKSRSTALRFPRIYKTIILRRDIIPHISWRDSRMERFVNPWRLLQGAEGAGFGIVEVAQTLKASTPPRVNQPSYRASFIFNASAHFAVVRETNKNFPGDTWCESRAAFLSQDYIIYPRDDNVRQLCICITYRAYIEIYFEHKHIKN